LYAIALPIFALACLGLVARSRLPLAVATQLSAGYAMFLVLSWRVGVPRYDSGVAWTHCGADGGWLVCARDHRGCVSAVICALAFGLFAYGTRGTASLASWTELREDKISNQSVLAWGRLFAACA
jgi:hypothetical protein